MRVVSEYRDFLASKRAASEPLGFAVDDGDLNQSLFPWQRAVVRWALRQGRAALFEECGLGKTLQQLEWASQVCRHTGGKVLILTPLAVGPQAVAEAGKFGIAGRVGLVKVQADCDGLDICVANYQKLQHFDSSAFSGVVLDESSILKAFMGSTKRALCEAFARTPYRLCCTATPAPNDHMELGNHSQFLGVMDSDEMLSRWFIADQANCGHYRLKGHAAADFWRWVSSWAACVSSPSDLGYPDEGYDLPPLSVVQHVVSGPVRPGAGRLFDSDKFTATTLHRELKKTAHLRAAKVAELVAGCPDEPWLIWCNTNAEADALKAAIPGVSEVRGSESDATKERKLMAFGSGASSILVSKPSLCGHGLNWQHCANVAFVGMSYSFEQFYQAIRRCWRFGQARPVACHVVTADGEGDIVATVERKQREHESMMREMVAATKENALGGRSARLALSNPKAEERSGNAWRIVLGDCVEQVGSLDSESVDFTIFSPPFSSLYIYSAAESDMGNSADDAEFFRHFGYLVPELLRVTVPGRLCAVHCKDLPKYAGRDGTAGLKDFPGECIRLFESHGWSYHSRVTVWKCPVVERERTNNNGLLHKTLKRDSTQLRQGMADYLIVFRRPPADGLMSAKPIARPVGLERYVGAEDPRVGSDPLTPVNPHPSPYSRRPSNDPALAVWQRYAEPVWWDIDQMDVLNYKLAKGGGDEKHICPLQLGLIRRAMHLWSEPGDLVLSPFAGVGSEGVVAVEDGRRFVGVELKPEYFAAAARHLASAEATSNEASLFDDEPSQTTEACAA